MKYAIGIDIGTSGTKAAIYDENGSVIKSCTKEYPLYQPQNGYAEQAPEDWWKAVCAALKTITDGFEGEISGVGLSGQMHGLVMLDKDGEVIRNAIIWCDGRTKEECGEITQRVGAKRLLEITANPAVAGFTAAKIMWVKKHEPQNYAKTAHILLPKDYIRYKLTNEFATDVSDASGMQLLDIEHRCWSDEVLEALEIDKKLLPKVYESVEITGKISDKAAAEASLKPGIAVVGGGGDNACAAVGTGVVREGRAFTTIGTSGVVFAHTPQMLLDKKGRIHTFCAAVPNEWHVMGVTQAAGLSLKWFRDSLCQEEKAEAERLGVDAYKLIDDMADSADIGADRLIYLPYLMGERTPHLDPDCRGVFFGLSARHTKAEMARAVLEGVAYSLRDCMEILRFVGVETRDMALCGGGAVSAVWRQMFADVYNCEIKIPLSNEGGCLGAAILAFVGTGVFDCVQNACDKIISFGKHNQPISSQAEKYNSIYSVYSSLYPALKESFGALSEAEI